jgi:hypothetical protein
MHLTIAPHIEAWMENVQESWLGFVGRVASTAVSLGLERMVGRSSIWDSD